MVMDHGISSLRGLMFVWFSSLDFELRDFLPSAYGIFFLELWGLLEMSTGGGPT